MSRAFGTADEADGNAVSRFASFNLAGKDGFEIFQEMFSDTVDVTDLADNKFFAEFKARPMDQCIFYWGDYSANFIERSASRVRKDGRDGITLFLLMSGHAVLDFGTHQLKVKPGDLYAVERGLPYKYHRATEFSVIAMGISPESLGEFATLSHFTHGRLLDCALSKLIKQYMLLAPEIDDGAATFHGRALRDATIALFEKNSGGAGAVQSLRSRAVTLIGASLEDPDLDVDLVADRLGCSRATLYRAFSSDGGIARYIRDRRLMKAAERIRGGERIGSVAFDLGFGDASQFSTAFRRKFGVRPTHLRGQAMPLPPIITDLDKQRLSRWLDLVNAGS